jgi:hypothetical protein
MFRWGVRATPGPLVRTNGASAFWTMGRSAMWSSRNGGSHWRKLLDNWRGEYANVAT